MYLCIAPLSRFYYPETRRFINAFIIIIIITAAPAGGLRTELRSSSLRLWHQRFGSMLQCRAAS